VNWIYKCNTCNNDFSDHRLFSGDVTICCPACGFIAKVQHGFEIIESPDPKKYYFSTKPEAKKLVKNRIEPQIKFYDFSKPEDCAEFEKDYGEGSSLEQEINRTMATHGEAFIRDGKVVDNDRVSFSDGKTIKNEGQFLKDQLKAFSDKMKEAFPELEKPFSREYVAGIEKVKVEAQFKAVDKLSPAIFKMQKKMLETELNRELTDFEAEQIIAFRDLFFKRTSPFKESKLIMASTPLRKDESDFFFRQFAGNEEVRIYHPTDNQEESFKALSKKRASDWMPNVKPERVNFQDFVSSDLGIPWTENEMGKIPNVDLKENEIGILPSVSYPTRHHFKKRKFSLKNLIDKVVKWWKS
jgi:DNA-directed RNA polymerase subunit RPC12/RpoP